MPALPVREVVVFPGTVVPLTVGREKSKRLIDDVMRGDRLLVVLTQRRSDTEDPTLDDVYRVGCAASIVKLLRNPDGTHNLLVHGIVRVGVSEFVSSDPYWRASIHPSEDSADSNIEISALVHNARQIAARIIELSPNIPEEAATILHNIEAPGALADFLSANLSMGMVAKQELLETFDVADRLRKIIAILQNQIEVLELAAKIQGDVAAEVDKTQRRYFLQEQMKAIRKELGEQDGASADREGLRKRLDAAGMPEAVAREANRELERLERIPSASPESGVIRDYLEWLCEMPWRAETTDSLDLDHAQQVLDADHFGLEKIKRRIIEYLAVRRLKPEGRGPILCFVGPPGVGKTSLGHSIARALGRKFARIALGGVRDEADIRGHRRTYIGAIPGRIVHELKRCGTRNPVIMLDELDKLGADFRGDPASALLEVLDPEQNHSFTDHYLAVPFDLSRVLFIATANLLDPVPAPLLDRMEVIALPGYTLTEKLEIAKRYLVPKQLDANGLAGRDIRFEDDALRLLIEGYTREAGVRNLERNIGSVCRHRAARVARGQSDPPTIAAPDLEAPLGPRRFETELAQVRGVVGVATGLAYTPVGGEIIFVEATAMRGRGSFQLTGQIGDVMRESAMAALSLLRSRASDWGLDVSDLPNLDVHVHVPAGGIPKDGPSAGVAMVTALASLLSHHPADASVALTGEITLRGLVLPIGGLKEKLLAAHRAGIRTVVIPARNAPDLEDVPAEVRSSLKIVTASTVDQVLAQAIPALTRQAAAKGGKSRRKRAQTGQTGVRQPRSSSSRSSHKRRK
ncbi:MAG: endopeptidase La [Phycisphaerales bacterium]|nr:endopeptidase La [Phycisphaerales bacterium]